MAAAPFCAADENDVVLIRARVVGNYGDDLQVEILAGRQVTKIFVGAGDVLTMARPDADDLSFRVSLAERRRTYLR